MNCVYRTRSTYSVLSSGGRVADRGGDGGIAQALRRRRRRSPASTSRSRRARSAGCSGPTARGRRRRCGSSRRCCGPDGGRAEVAGFDVVRQAAQVRARIGLTVQHDAVDEVLTGRQNLVHVRPALPPRRGAPPAAARTSCSSSSGSPRRPTARPSTTRAGCAAGSISRPASSCAPQVLFLDEPTTGQDPRNRNEVWEVVRGLVARRDDRAAHHALPRRGRPARRPRSR